MVAKRSARSIARAGGGLCTAHGASRTSRRRTPRAKMLLLFAFPTRCQRARRAAGSQRDSRWPHPRSWRPRSSASAAALPPDACADALLCAAAPLRPAVYPDRSSLDSGRVSALCGQITTLSRGSP